MLTNAFSKQIAWPYMLGPFIFIRFENCRVGACCEEFDDLNGSIGFGYCAYLMR